MHIPDALLLVSLVLAPAATFAQDSPVPDPRLVNGLAHHPQSRLLVSQFNEEQRPSLALGEEMSGAQQKPGGSSRDSLKNGAIIGAVVGAVALGTVGAVICNVYQEKDGPSCLPDTLRVAALGAAIGIGAGLVVDVAFTRQAGVAVRLGVRF